MTRIKIVTIGEVRQKFILQGEAEYLKRLKPHCKIELVEIRTEKFAKLEERERKKREAELVLSKLQGSQYWLLDERGAQFTSTELSLQLDAARNGGISSFTFVIGAAHGIDRTVKDSAQRLWSLSKLTFPFQLTRLILIEQLYRAVSIQKGSPYHK
ncbi:MAG: 23S rRNA (pseudouridine(1915)-N(3))-methyltransferase RlmH [Deltaproteobacteria bacterium]|nr:23S rRNA (pseudouridine(1915)-N(3))-methyltransferase RlmH [Deltaproteobacteria bacterium]